MKTPRRLTSFLTVTVAVLAAAVAAQLRVVDLGALPDAQFSQAWAINNRGQVAGSSGGSEGTDQHAALWRDGEWLDLGTLPGHTYSLALDINKHGDVVGSSRSTIENTRAVLWHRGAPIDLGTLPGGSYSTADAINDRGQVAGTALDADGQLHLVRWDRGQMVDLGLFPSPQWRWVSAINDRGVIVGYGDGASAFVWREGMFSELTALNGSASSVAYDVDSRGCVVGYSATRQWGSACDALVRRPDNRSRRVARGSIQPSHRHQRAWADRRLGLQQCVRAARDPLGRRRDHRPRHPAWRQLQLRDGHQRPQHHRGIQQRRSRPYGGSRNRVDRATASVRFTFHHRHRTLKTPRPEPSCGCERRRQLFGARATCLQRQASTAAPQFY